MNRLRAWLSILWTTLYDSINRFPETLLISLSFVVVMIVNNRMDYDSEQVLTRVAMILGLGIPVSVSCKLLMERYQLSRYTRLAADLALFVCGMAFWLLLPEALDSTFMMRYGAATAIAYLVFTLIPYLWHRAYYSLYCVKLLIGFLVTYLYTIVLYLGVIAIIFAVDFLFELNIDEAIYFDTFIAAVGLFGLTFFLGKVPKISEDISWYRYPSVLRILLVGIVVPIISIYTLVLYAYLIRIIVDIGWNGSFVTRLVIWYGYSSIGLMILLAPLKEESRAVRQFYRIYPLALPVPLMMLFVSMIIRINAYGLTVPRGLVMLSWLWFLLAAVYVIIRQDKSSQHLVAMLILIFLVGLFAPANVFGISNSRQIMRLTGYLEGLNMLVDNRIVAREDLDDGDRILISNSLSYLDEYRGMEEVSYLPDEFTLKDMENVFGFPHMYERYYVNEYGRTYIGYHLDVPVITDIQGYDRHMMITGRSSEDMALTGTSIEASGSDSQLGIYLDGEVVYEASVEELLTAHEDNLLYNTGDEPIIIKVEGDWGVAKLLFTELHGSVTDEEVEIDHYRVHVFLRVLD